MPIDHVALTAAIFAVVLRWSGSGEINRWSLLAFGKVESSL